MSPWSNATTEDEVADEDEVGIAVEIVVETTDVEVVGKTVVIALTAVTVTPMTGRSVVRMIVLPDSETIARTAEVGAEIVRTTEEVVETDVTIGATTETRSARRRRSK